MLDAGLSSGFEQDNRNMPTKHTKNTKGVFFVVFVYFVGKWKTDDAREVWCKANAAHATVNPFWILDFGFSINPKSAIKNPKSTSLELCSFVVFLNHSAMGRKGVENEGISIN